MANTLYPRFTVIIPQKNRAEYLLYTLKSCMIQDYPNFEIIVSDDCSDDNSVEIVRQMQKADKRIKLLAHSEHIGMRMNFESALDEVSEGYVLALGGDDGLVPGCIWRMYEIINETGTELLTWSNACFKYPIFDGDISIFSVPRRIFKGVKLVRSVEFLNQISESLFYLVDDCPMFYIKGVASVSLVNKVKSRTPDGCFYYCPTPDGFSGVVLAGEVEKYAYTREPLTISGDSTKSQGRNYKRTDEKSKMESEQFFSDNARRTMHPSLALQPYSPLITLMTADYLLTAKDLPGWPGKFKMFTWRNLLDKTFGMLIKDTFADEVLIREMNILKEIAIQHGEEDYFNRLLLKTKRKLVFDKKVDGFLVTPNVFEFNGNDIHITNVFEAALATPFAYHFCNQLSISFVIKWIFRTIKVIANSFNYKVSYLPGSDKNKK